MIARLNGGQILTAEEMRAAERRIFDTGVSVDELMRQAGEGAAQWIWRVVGPSQILVVCGPGNNGGDGYVIAEWLRNKGCDVIVARAGEPGSDASKNAASRWSGESVALADAKARTVFVDCLFGTGLSRAIVDELFTPFKGLKDGATTTFAVDMPSGIATDDGSLFNDPGAYDATLALGALKPSYLLQPAARLIGELLPVDIGIDAASDLAVLAKPELSVPAVDAHKYKRGLVAIVAGAMPGAAWLTAKAAQKSGAGYVKILSPDGRHYPPSSIVCDSDGELRGMLSDDRIGALVIGPGLGRDDRAHEKLELAIASPHPLLLDADALVILEEDLTEKLAARKAPTILTPHDGEFKTLCPDLDGDKVSRVRSAADALQAVTLLKGPDTVIAGPDGSAAVSTPSTSWLSTAGSGDVLAGVIAARMAVDGDMFAAARQGQWLHARAARLAGPSCTPEMLIDQLPTALAQCL